METILITGGSGTIGMELSAQLVAKNYAVRHLSRSVSGNEKYPTFKWNISENKIDPKVFEEVDYIIHLAGENVSSGRWTNARKDRMRKSRIASLDLIRENFPPNQKIKALISASGISIYGTETTENIYKEDAPKTTDYLAQLSVDWEDAASKFETLAERIAMIRTGVVLSKTGGALAKLIQPIKMGIGSPLGTGKQYMPWLHIADIVGIYMHAIENQNISGAYNAVSSVHTTNKEMTQAIAKKLDKKLWAPKVPAFALHLLFGEMANIILKGSRIDNEKIKSAGYEFKYDSLEVALEDLIG